MRARGRRDELIALVALVAIAAAITVGGALSHSDDSSGADRDPTASSPSPTPSPQPTATPSTPTDDNGVRLGDDAFVYACRLITPEDVTRIYGASGPQGYVRQQYLDRTPTASELAGARAFGYGGVSTGCTHWFDDKAGHQLDVDVTQFPSTRLVQRRFATLTHSTGHGKHRQPPAGRVVPGTDHRVLYLANTRSFLLAADDLTVEVHYSSRRDGKRFGPLPTREYAAQVPQVRQVLAAADRHVADDTAVEGPLPTNAGIAGTVGGTPYVDPCSVLTETAYDALGGPPSEPVVVDTSVIEHDPFADAAVSSCERTGVRRVGGPRRASTTSAVLEVRAAPDPTSAQAVLRRHLAARYGPHVQATPLRTDVGTAYVVDLPGTRSDPTHTRAVHVVVGAYELRLAAVEDVSVRHPAGRAPTRAQLSAAITALATALAAASPDAGAP